MAWGAVPSRAAATVPTPVNLYQQQLVRTSLSCLRTHVGPGTLSNFQYISIHFDPSGSVHSLLNLPLRSLQF